MNQKDIDQIVEFGFSREQAIEALSVSAMLDGDGGPPSWWEPLLKGSY